MKLAHDINDVYVKIWNLGSYQLVDRWICIGKRAWTREKKREGWGEGVMHVILFQWVAIVTTKINNMPFGKVGIQPQCHVVGGQHYNFRTFTITLLLQYLILTNHVLFDVNFEHQLDVANLTNVVILMWWIWPAWLVFPNLATFEVRKEVWSHEVIWFWAKVSHIQEEFNTSGLHSDGSSLWGEKDNKSLNSWIWHTLW